MRLKIIGHERINIAGKSQSCMVYQLPMIFKRTRTVTEVEWLCGAGFGAGTGLQIYTYSCTVQLQLYAGGGLDS